VAVLLNCGESADQLLAQFDGTARAAHAPERGRMDLRSYGVGAQILRDCGVQRMQLLGTPRRLPSMARRLRPGSGRLHHQGIRISMFGADKGQSLPLDGRHLRIGIVQARFNEGVTNAPARRLPGRAGRAGRAEPEQHHPPHRARRAGSAAGAAVAGAPRPGTMR
jgi:hypothetical protein